MNIRIITSENFRKKAKRLLKKYRSLKTELLDLEKQLKENPEMGIPLGNDCYKIRIAIESKGKGKSGGARIISHVIVRVNQNDSNKVVGLLTIYDKSEYDNISDLQLNELLKEIKTELNELN